MRVTVVALVRRNCNWLLAAKEVVQPVNVESVLICCETSLGGALATIEVNDPGNVALVQYFKSS